MRVPILKCKCCGKPINTYLRNMSEYVYKLPKKRPPNCFNYYCSYTCFRKEQKILEEQKTKAYRTRLVNKYNGFLNFKEANELEDIRAWINTKENFNFTSRNEYEAFLSRHKKLINNLKSKGYL